MKWKNSLLALAMALLLSGCESSFCLIYCHDSTDIQNGYVYARDDCQGTAEDIVSGMPSYNGDPKARNADLLENFARCMKQKGWGVTSPKKTTTKPGGPNDNSNLAGNPWDPSPYGARQAVIAQPQPQQVYGYYPQPQPYGYSPYPAPPAYGYSVVPVPQPAYGYYPAPQPQPQYRQPQQNYAPSSNFPTEGRDFEAFGDGNSNRAGIGLAPGF